MKLTAPTHKRTSATQRSNFLELYRRSRLTQRQFAAQARIGLSTLQLWLRNAKAAGGQKPSEFLPIANLLPPGPSVAAYRFDSPRSGLGLEVRTGFQPQELKQLLEILRSL
jgi:hypothetical protein